MAPTRRQLRWQMQRLLRPARRALLRRLYRDNNRRLADSILVAGTARSGTTWLGDVLVGENGRILFEPFHPHKIAALRGLSYFPYLRPDEANAQLAAYARQVFSGAIRHPWIDREIGQLRPTFRVIKEIRTNLCLKWLRVQFPEVPQLLIVRHPCAVALSRRQLGWATDSDILAFLEQWSLLQDHLAPHLDTIHRAETDLEKHAVIWCVSHLIPLRQFAPGELTIIFYEDLCLRPERELARIERAVGRPFPPTTLAALGKPSATTTVASAVLTGDNRVTRWQNSLTTAEIGQILAVVAAFGLDGLYGDSPLPQIETIGELRFDIT
jgi:hypothetical protein